MQKCDEVMRLRVRVRVRAKVRRGDAP